jgi:hypothetical protein
MTQSCSKRKHAHLSDRPIMRSGYDRLTSIHTLTRHLGISYFAQECFERNPDISSTLSLALSPFLETLASALTSFGHAEIRLRRTSSPHKQTLLSSHLIHLDRKAVSCALSVRYLKNLVSFVLLSYLFPQSWLLCQRSHRSLVSRRPFPFGRRGCSHHDDVQSSRYG